MKIHWIIILLYFFLLSCEDDNVILSESELEKVFNEFSVQQKHNPGLIQDVIFDRVDSIYKAVMPNGFYNKKLVASFKLKNGFKAFVNGIEQKSGKNINDFSKLLRYKIEGPSGSISYYIEVDFNFQVPSLNIKTINESPITSKEDYIDAHITIDGAGIYQNIQSYIKIRGRGNSTWDKHPKKPYQIKFEEKVSILGMPEDKRWVLLAEYSDKTFLRNITAFELGYLSDLEWTPETKFANVIINGEIKGLYLISQKVEESSNRLSITNEGYLLEVDQLDRLDDDDFYFNTSDFLLNIKEPQIKNSGTEFDYINSYISNFEEALYSEDFLDIDVGYSKYININSVVDWFWINEIAKNIDAISGSSIYMYLRPEDKLRLGPIWDFDLGFGNVNYADTEHPERWWVKANPWIHKMFSDPEFVELIKNRYYYFRSKKQFLFDRMDEHALYIKQSQNINNEVWQTIGKEVWPNPVVFDSYEEELAYLKTWIEKRFEWLDVAVQDL